METRRGPAVTAWAARFAPADAGAAARLRLVPGVEAAVVGETLWVRGHAWSDALADAADRAAALALFAVDAERRLTPFGSLLPTLTLPDATWAPIGDVLPVAVPAALAPAAPPARVRVTLKRSPLEEASTALLTDFTHFADWCDTAPGVRLGRLRFAVQWPLALVLGDPLPPLPGTPLCGTDGLLLPNGFAFDPPVDAPSLRLLLRLGEHDVALFQQTGWSHIAASNVVPVTRTAVRLSALECPA